LFAASTSSFTPAKDYDRQDKLLAELKRTDLDSQPPWRLPIRRSTAARPSMATPRREMGRTLPATINIKGQPTKALDDAVYAGASC